MANVPFELRLELVTPVIQPFMLTLDGLLSYAAEALTGERGEALKAHIPLEEEAESQIYRASSITLGPDRFYQRHVKVRSLKHDDLFLPHIAPKMTKSGKLAKTPYTPLDKKRGDYANKLTDYMVISATTATCYGFGDTEQVLHLLEVVQGLGKHAAQGMGEIRNPEIRELSNDFSWITREGLPARPLPIEVWNRVGNASAEHIKHGLGVCRFPYWEQPPEKAVLPSW